MNIVTVRRCLYKSEEQSLKQQKEVEKVPIHTAHTAQEKFSTVCNGSEEHAVNGVLASFELFCS